MEEEFVFGFSLTNIRRWLLAELAGSGRPTQFLEAIRMVLDDIDGMTDDEIVQEAFGGGHD